MLHFIVNSAQRPWIVTFGHRPMYCSNDNDNDCTHSETLTRVGLPFTHFFGLEDLFYKYGVDVEIWAHEHSYERLWPIYDYKVRERELGLFFYYEFIFVFVCVCDKKQFCTDVS